jgi:cobalt/nickel transport system permease protein
MNHKIDSLSYTNRLRWLPPGHKLSFAIVLLGLSLISSPTVQVLITLWLGIWIVVYAGIPMQTYVQMMVLPIGFWVSSALAIVLGVVSLEQLATIQSDTVRPFQGQFQGQPLGVAIGPMYLYVSQTGIFQTSVLFTRMLATTSSLYFILLTTPFTEVLQILRRLRCPALLVELLMLMYRFIFTLLAISEELWIAQNARSGYRTWRRGMQSLGILVGQLLQRTLEHYRALSLTIASRGFESDFRVYSSAPHRASKRYTVEALLGCTVLIIISLMSSSIYF